MNIRSKITSTIDLLRIINQMNEISLSLSLRKSEKCTLGTIISELGRNIIIHADTGEISIAVTEENERTGVVITAQDFGPGISDVDKALRDHFSTKGSLGLGLPGVKRMSDELIIETSLGHGTKITAIKWIDNA